MQEYRKLFLNWYYYMISFSKKVTWKVQVTFFVVYFPSDKENDERVDYGCFKGHIVRLCSGEQEKVLNVLC